MNKALFFTGATIFGLEALGVLVLLGIQNPSLASKLILGIGLIGINIAALFMLIIGATSK